MNLFNVKTHYSKSSITNRLRDLWVSIKALHTKRTALHHFVMQYDYVNIHATVMPFVASLNKPYLELGSDCDVVFLKSDKELVLKLSELGFREASESFPGIRYFAKLLNLTEGLCTSRVYHAEFNIDLHLVDSERMWKNLHVAKIMMDCLEFKNKAYLLNFIKVHNILTTHVF
jgi:hypothetical protein